VFGKATHLLAQQQAEERGNTVSTKVEQHAGDAKSFGLSSYSPRALALGAMLDLGVFFAVLLVGFAYVWRRGDLDWVRAVATRPCRPKEGRFRCNWGVASSMNAQGMYSRLDDRFRHWLAASNLDALDPWIEVKAEGLLEVPTSSVANRTLVSTCYTALRPWTTSSRMRRKPHRSSGSRTWN